MLLTVVMVMLSGPLPETCSLTGTVQFDEKMRSALGGRPMVVYVEKVASSVWSRSSRGKQEMHQRGLKFDPPVAVLLKEESLSFINDDKQEHGVFANSQSATFNVQNSDPKTFEQTFHKEGYTHIQCDIHELMSADVLVVQNPYFAFVTGEGKWTIADLPRSATEYRLKAWEPNGGREQAPVTFKCGSEPIAPLVLTVDVKPKPRPLHRNHMPWQHDRGVYPRGVQPGS